MKQEPDPRPTDNSISPKMNIPLHNNEAVSSDAEFTKIPAFPKELSSIVYPGTSALNKEAPVEPSVETKTETTSSDAELLSPSKGTGSSAFRWLGIGVVGGGVANVAYHMSAAYIGATYLLASDAKITLGIALAVSTLFSLMHLKERLIPSKRKSEGGDLQEVEFDRAQKIIESFPGFQEITVTSEPGIPFLGFIDRSGTKRDELLINPEFTTKLSDDDLKGIIAHELSHSGRYYTALDDLSGISGYFAAQMVFWGVASGVYSYIAPEGLFSSGSAMIGSGIAAISSAVLFGLGVLLSNNIASRANEIRTDIRGAQLLEDPDAYTDALEKIYIASDELPKALEWMSAHPNFEIRKSWIQKAFKDS